MRLGVFGGTFDPVHLGHLILAEQCREQAALDQVLFVPAARPPHKAEGELSTFDRRVEMLQLAVAGHGAFRVDELEKNRSGPSYTVDTLTILSERHQGTELFLIIGSDTLHDLGSWYEPARIVGLASLLVTPRPSWPVLEAETVRRALRLDKPVRLQAVRMPLLEIASREIRRWVREGRSIRYLVPRAVEMYIQEKRLYF
jgi:nicotinate-nucleotide adenylyltransferase